MDNTKVWILIEHTDYGEYYTSAIIGIYATRELAITGRDDYVLKYFSIKRGSDNYIVSTNEQMALVSCYVGELVYQIKEYDLQNNDNAL